jgi:hypothetical protein
MSLGEWKTPYDLGVSTTTLRALEGKGLVEAKLEIGILFFPRMKEYKKIIKLKENGK